MRRHDYLSYQATLLENYVLKLPPHPLFERRVQFVDVEKYIERERCCELRPSSECHTIFGVYKHTSGKIAKKTKILDYPGYLLTNEEYDNFPYSVFTAVALNYDLMSKIDPDYPRRTIHRNSLVLLGDPRCLGANLVCVRGPSFKGEKGKSIN
jgi:hypothetical protein